MIMEARVALTVKMAGGEILSATMDNLVEAIARECVDADLSHCGEPRSDRTVRRVEMSLSGSGAAVGE